MNENTFDSKDTVTLVLRCAGEEDIEMTISTETYVGLLRVWSAIEAERGQCLDFNEFLALSLRRVIDRAAQSEARGA